MKGYKHLTEDQRHAILETYERTLSAPATARALGVSIDQVRNHLRASGIKPKYAQGGACYRHVDDVRRWAAEGVSFSEIARRIGTKHQSVAKFLRMHGLPFERIPQVGPNNPAWKGGRTRDKAGYILIYRPDHPQANRHGYVREHRLVMEGVLGRPLLRTEVVDHIDGDTSNNTPSNLRVFASNRDHLAATLAGRTPDWTPEGRSRLRDAFDRGLGLRNAASHLASGSGDPQ